MQPTTSILTIAALMMTLVLVVQGLKAWITYDRPRAYGALVGALLVSLIAFQPGLLTELIRKLAEHMLGDIVPQPASPTHERPGTRNEPFTLQWSTIGPVLAGLAAVLALVLAAAAVSQGLRRRRERSATQKRRNDDLARRRANLQQRHDAILELYGDFEINLLDNLHRLALADVNVAQTAQLIDALDAARDARISTAPEALDTYRKAVTALELAWKSADHHARTTGPGYLPAAERRNIEQAQAALAIALDERGHAPQRQLALRRALTLIESVIPVPKEAIAALESSTRPALAKN